MRIHESLGYETERIGVLFTLLMEHEYLTIKQLAELTQISKSNIKRILTELTSPSSNFPVLQTKIPNNKHIHYYCALDLEEYLEIILREGVGSLDIEIDFLPVLIGRLTSLKNQTSDVLHVTRFFSFYYQIFKYYVKLVKSTEKFVFDLTKNFLEMDELPHILPEELIIPKIPSPEKPLYKNDTLKQIKQDFINYLRSWTTTSSKTGKTQLQMAPLAIIFALWLESGPATQETLIEVTKYSRSTISEELSTLVQQGLVRVEKNPKNRKKYFELKIKIEDFIRLRLEQTKRPYTQVIKITQDRFQPTLSELEIEDSEKQKLNEFFIKVTNTFKFGELHIKFLNKSLNQFINILNSDFPI